MLPARAAARVARLREAAERIADPATIQAKLSGLPGAQKDTLLDLYRKSRAGLTDLEMAQRREIIALFRQTAKDIEADIFSVFSDIRAEGGTWDLASVRRIGRDKTLFDQIKNRLNALGASVTSQIDDGILDQFKQTWIDGAYRLDVMTPTSTAINFGILPDREIGAMLAQPFKGGTFSERLGIITDEMALSIKNELIRSMMAEESWGDAARRIRDEMGTEGTSSVWRAEMIARTELGRAQELANAELYAQNSDVIEKVIWVAHPGACDVCMDLHGTEVNDVEEYPPTASHPNCLCDTLAVPKGWDALADSSDGSFPVRPPSMKSWVKSKSS